MEEITRQFIQEYFSKLPKEKEREYEKLIAKLAEKCIDDRSVGVLKSIVDDQSDYSYEAFQCILTIYRRNKDFEMMKSTFEQYPQFKKRLSYNHLMVQYLVHSESFYDYNDLLLMAYRDTRVFDENAGYHQAFANAFVTICECCNDEDRKEIIDQWYMDALYSVNKAIELDVNYAKFYCTKGRILAQKSQYFEAINLINHAISIENSLRPDYALTIMTYELNKMRIQNKYEKKVLCNRIEMMEKKIDAMYLNTNNVDSNTLSSQSDNNCNEINAYIGPDSYAFVSYAHKDQNAVYDIIGNLQNKKARVWFDKGLEIGKEWPEEIAKHLIDSSLVLVMLSSNAIQSANVRREVNLALSEEKDIIVIKLDDVDLSPGMKLQLGLYQMIMKTQYGFDKFSDVLFKSVCDRLEK